eukprot:909366-Amphidinium_carterae.1
MPMKSNMGTSHAVEAPTLLLKQLLLKQDEQKGSEQSSPSKSPELPTSTTASPTGNLRASRSPSSPSAQSKRSA